MASREVRTASLGYRGREGGDQTSIGGYRIRPPATVADLKEPTARLEVLRGRIPDTLLDQAHNALAQGDRSQADKCFAQIEARTEVAIRTAAEAAYQRSRIALDEIRYRSAYAHAQRAARLVPEDGLYLTSAGELARMLGHTTSSRPCRATSTPMRGPPRSRDTLQGVTWLKLGEPRKALGYLESALASDLDSCGEDHPTVAIRRNNLGAVWQALGEYQNKKRPSVASSRPCRFSNTSWGRSILP